MINEKAKVAFTSVIAAIFLTSLKLVVGLATSSLGIISEAIHSALDLGAALITLFAVRISDKPADKNHHYGHGKVENLSALIQAVLLLITCGWIMYEAVRRLFKPVAVEVSIYSFLVIIISIIVDLSRSRILMRAAKKHNSQALEADAYHFSSDVLSSVVVVFGLICVKLGFAIGDSIAAMVVSLVIIVISIRLGKRTIEVLLDSAPEGVAENIEEKVKTIEGVVECKSVRARASGSLYFVDVNAGLDKYFSHKEIQDTTYKIKSMVLELLPNSDVVVSTYPVHRVSFENEDEVFFNEIRSLINSLDICMNLHHMKVFNIGDARHIALHIEVRNDLSLEETHRLSHLIESKIKTAVSGIIQIDVLVESMKQEQISVQDVTENSKDIISNIEELINKVPHKLNCHNIKIYKQDNKMVSFLHCGLYGNHSNEKIRSITKSVINKIKRNINNMEDVYIHVEPLDE